ncbi:MAG: DNA-processing protein DprA [Treponema sp.]|jgi:DNA processing protein|nr:DNA-processing protein DprA [Treponema sp.]
MDERGLLDLIVSLLPDLKATDKITMQNALNSEEELYLHSKQDIEKLINRKLKRCWDINEIRDRADRIDTICRMRSIKWVSWTSAEYPPLLREIYDSPSVIFYRGVLPNPEKSLLGMVGTRKPSPEAADQSNKIAYNAGQAGISVVSGLAFGIDAMSHRGNLSGGAAGFAVLGSGVDEIYPLLNRPLAKRILDCGGALISEYPPGVRPSKWTFPARNRIISALSRSVIIVEAPQKSGALITASFALEQGKDLWVASTGVLPSTDGRTLYDKRGTVKLAEDGAEIIYSARDIFEKWNMKITGNDDNSMVPGKETLKSELISYMANFLDIEI